MRIAAARIAIVFFEEKLASCVVDRSIQAPGPALRSFTGAGDATHPFQWSKQ
jgi:hypothetical protein